METKRYIGNDMARLYDRVRRDLGPDAVIVRTRTLEREGAPPLVELIAAPPAPGDFLSLAEQQSLLDALAARLGPSRPNLTVAELEELLGDVAPTPPLEHPRPARAAEPPPWLEGFVPGVPSERVPGHGREATPRHESPPQGFARARGLRETLAEAGFTAAAVDELVASAGPDADPADALATLLSGREVSYPAEDEVAIIAVLGPTASGRTTALVRMALDCADSGRPVRLVAADPVRIAAREQVHAFGEALGIPVDDVFEPGDLATIIARARPGTCLFADVPSGPWDGDAVAGAGVYRYLALPAHWQRATLERAVAALADCAFDGCILTFTDLATELQGPLSLVVESPLGIAFTTAGRDVADGVTAFDAFTFASGIFMTRSGEGTNGSLAATA